VNNFLTGVLWGQEVDGKWEWISNEPSLRKPEAYPNSITYFKYLENQVVKVAIDRKMLREKTGNFVNHEGVRFKPYYDKLIRLLLYNEKTSEKRFHEDEIIEKEKTLETEKEKEDEIEIRPQHQSILYDEALPVNSYRSADGTLYHYILPAFFRLIRYLQRTNREYAIILRTMGDDSINFLQNAQNVLSNQHPNFLFEKLTNVNLNPGRIRRTGKLRKEDEKITLELPNPHDQDELLSIDDEVEISHRLKQFDGIHAIKDDFNYWCDNDYLYSSSKPIWFDPEKDIDVHDILFDDNFRVIDPNDSVVDIRLMNENTQRYKTVSFEHYSQLENVFAVQADLMEILENENYYIEKVEECERNLADLLSNTEILNRMRY
ncbi:unnamed protein product, partial [Didymodactylos carnosus]